LLRRSIRLGRHGKGLELDKLAQAWLVFLLCVIAPCTGEEDYVIDSLRLLRRLEQGPRDFCLVLSAFVRTFLGMALMTVTYLTCRRNQHTCIHFLHSLDEQFFFLRVEDEDLHAFKLRKRCFGILGEDKCSERAILANIFLVSREQLQEAATSLALSRGDKNLAVRRGSGLVLAVGRAFWGHVCSCALEGGCTRVMVVVVGMWGTELQLGGEGI
jgi:hypothetical protein